jgi:hypothetical protein
MEETAVVVNEGGVGLLHEKTQAESKTETILTVRFCAGVFIGQSLGLILSLKIQGTVSIYIILKLKSNFFHPGDVDFLFRI